jgi:hypothetical protein
VGEGETGADVWGFGAALLGVTLRVESKFRIVNMIPIELLKLGCREYATEELARQAIQNSFHAGDETIRYRVDVKPDRPSSPLRTFATRAMFCRQLPNGNWGWIPEDPDDAAIVAEHKKRYQNTIKDK